MSSRTLGPLDRRRFSFLVLIGAALVPVADAPRAQQAAQTPLQFDTAVDVVSIQVSVADEAGQFVAGLGPEDFLLEVAGSSRSITAAYAVDARAAEAAPADLTEPATTGAVVVGATGSRPPAARRHFLVFVDLTTMNRAALRNACDAARRFVADYSAPADMIGMAIYSPTRGLDYMVTFTTDHELTLSTLDVLQTGRAGESIDDVGEGVPLADLAAAVQADGAAFFEEMEMARVEMQAENTLNAQRSARTDRNDVHHRGPQASVAVLPRLAGSGRGGRGRAILVDVVHRSCCALRRGDPHLPARQPSG